MSRASLAVAVGAAFAVALASGVAATDAPPVEEDYTLHCSACHGADGAGVPERVPGLRDVGLLAASPAGRDYLMRVPGAAQSPLDDARLARLLDWVAVRFGGAAEPPGFTAAEVARVRWRPLRDPARARAKVFEAGG